MKRRLTASKAMILTLEDVLEKCRLSSSQEAAEESDWEERRVWGRLSGRGGRRGRNGDGHFGRRKDDLEKKVGV